MNAPGPEDKQVIFATKVQVRPIPAANQGRRCDNEARKKWQSKIEKIAVKGEVSQESAKSEENPKDPESGGKSDPNPEKPRWADVFDYIEGDCEREILWILVEVELLCRTFGASHDSKGELWMEQHSGLTYVHRGIRPIYVGTQHSPASSRLCCATEV